MATHTPARQTGIVSAEGGEEVVPKSFPAPVKLWGALGGACVAFILIIWARWITGPYFRSVPAGPSREPAWMSSLQVVYQGLSVVAVLAMVWFLLVRPWRRERRLTINGALVVATFFVWFQDPLTNWFQPWFQYNTNMWNRGSWANDVPGFLAFGKPGAMIIEPPMFICCLYIYMFTGIAILGSVVMRKTAARLPRMGPIGLILICYATIFTADLVLEGLLWMPLGFYSYPGAPWPVMFADTYHSFPIHEPVFGGLFLTGFAALHYFRDDRGLSFVERGAAKIEVPWRRNVVRLLAIIGATQAMMFVGYTIPTNLIIARYAHQWPVDVQKRSYFLGGLCGADTLQACPGPGVPLLRGNDSARVGPNGELVPATGVAPPTLIPFADTGHGRG